MEGLNASSSPCIGMAGSTELGWMAQIRLVCIFALFPLAADVTTPVYSLVGPGKWKSDHLPNQMSPQLPPGKGTYHELESHALYLETTFHASGHILPLLAIRAVIEWGM